MKTLCKAWRAQATPPLPTRSHKAEIKLDQRNQRNSIFQHLVALSSLEKTLHKRLSKGLVADSLTYSDPCLLTLSQSSLDVNIFLSRIFVSRSSRRITGEKRKRDDVDAFREYEESVAELYSNLGVSLSSLECCACGGDRTNKEPPWTLLICDSNGRALWITVASQRVQINASQVGDARPVSSCKFSPDQKWIATGSWSGQAKLWNFPSCENEKTLKGHTEVRSNCVPSTWRS